MNPKYFRWQISVALFLSWLGIFVYCCGNFWDVALLADWEGPTLWLVAGAALGAGIMNLVVPRKLVIAGVVIGLFVHGAVLWGGALIFRAVIFLFCPIA